MDKNKTARILIYIFVFILVIGGIGRIYIIKRNEKREVRLTRFCMDTYVEVIITSSGEMNLSEKQKIEGIVFRIFEELDKKYSFYSDDNLLHKINAGPSYTVDDAELLYILKTSLEYAKKTRGAFDPTLGRLQRLYPIGKENPVPPTPEEIEKALGVSGYKRVELKENILTKPPDTEIDLGGVLKGYAVDKAFEEMKKAGYNNFLINGGGNIRACGVNSKEEVWKIGVEHPRNPGDVLDVISLDNQAVATSGDYQRFFYYKGKRYHHILDSTTGEPADKCISATIISDSAMKSDILSTAVFVMGKEKGQEFLEKEKLSGIITDEKGTKKIPPSKENL